MEKQTKTKQRKEVKFDADNPKLNLGAIVEGAILVDTIRRKELIIIGIHKRDDSSSWGYFETLSRREWGIHRTIYRGHIEDELVYGVHIHEVLPYKKSLLKRGDTNQRFYYSCLDKDLKKAGL